MNFQAHLSPLLLSTSDNLGGAQRAALRLNQSLCLLGHHAKLMVQVKRTTDPNVFEKSFDLPEKLKPIQGELRNLEDKVRRNLDWIPLKLYPNYNDSYFSPSLITDNLASRCKKMNPDLIHLHWVQGGFLKIETLLDLEKPIVWTLHDSWVFTGGCHVPKDCTRYLDQCGNCPILGKPKLGNAESDLSRKVWLRKQEVFSKKQITFISPSKWLAETARKSQLLHDKDIHVIPNGLDLNFFKPMSKNRARELLRLPKNKKLLLFGGMNSTSDQNKGFDLLVSALKSISQHALAKNTELLVLGNDNEFSTGINLPTHGLGFIDDDGLMVKIYSAADAVVIPSRQESFGLMAAEAMACGTPVVAFGATGLLDIVDHKINGYLAAPYLPRDLFEGITWILGDHSPYLAGEARKKAESKFNIKNIAKAHEKLYRSVLNF